MTDKQITPPPELGKVWGVGRIAGIRSNRNRADARVV